MPDKHERYNRFMKYLAPGYGEPGALTKQWSTYKSTCEVCGNVELRDTMQYKDGALRCQTCLKMMTMGDGLTVQDGEPSSKENPKR